jgi:hypothetical protein
MTQSEHALSRPEFESIDLDLTAEETHRHIEETVKGLTATETDGGRKYRTKDGMLVAIVGRRGSGNGETKATLAYRTEPASELATRKATKLAAELRSVSPTQ